MTQVIADMPLLASQALLSQLLLVIGISSCACMCQPGYSGPDAGPCSACEAGKFKSVNSSDIADTKCLTCPTRDYSCSFSRTHADSDASMDWRAGVWCVDPSSSEWISAVLCAPANHTINFAPGVYTGGCGATLERNVRLKAAPSGSATLDCLGADRHFVVGTGASVVIDGLMLTNGRAVSSSRGRGDGGCIFAQANASLSIRNSMFTRCSANMSGGALVLTAGTSATIIGSAFENCSASNGGGIAAHNGSRLELQNSRIEGNVAVSSGGGLFLQSACNATIECTTIAANGAGDYGGGLFGRDRVQVLVLSSYLVDNNLTNPSLDSLGMSRGGGIYVDTDSILGVTNTTVSRNTALNRGGGPCTRIVHLVN